MGATLWKVVPSVQFETLLQDRSLVSVGAALWNVLPSKAQGAETLLPQTRSLVSVGATLWKVVPSVQFESCLQTRSVVTVGAAVWKVVPRTHLVVVTQDGAV